MSVIKGISCEEIIQRGSIGEGDVLRLRSACYGNGGISAEEADELLRIDASCTNETRTWGEFVVEAITDYIVNQAEPEGYINAANSEWLIARVTGADGRVKSRAALELVVNVIDRARWSPESLVRFALAQVRDQILAMNAVHRTIGEPEVDLLRRILYAFGGDGHVAVTRAEAEVLFDIDAAIADGPASPAFTDLFVKAIANVVMATSGYAVPSREEALRREAWLSESGDITPLELLRSVVALPGLLAGYVRQTPEETALDRLERQRIELIVNERVTEGEAQWLAECIGRDGRLSPNEAALLTYLERESPDIHPLLRELVARHAKAA